MDSGTSDFRTGYVAIVGEPNVGKSTLLNALVGAKLSIVSRKPQTTRKSVLGILSTDDAQMIFLDTPGILTPKYLLHEKLVGYVHQAVHDADVILLMLDAAHPDLERLAATPLGDVRKLGKPMVLLLNKVDTLHDKKTLLPVMEKFLNLGIFQEIIPLSALKGENVEVIPGVLRRFLPEGEPLFDPELISRQPMRFFAAELIREQVLQLYRKEIPYSVEVNIVEFKDREEPAKVFISAEIIVERETQKKILIGRQGEALKNLGSRARVGIEEFIERPVFLELFVKVRSDWRSDENRLRTFGY